VAISTSFTTSQTIGAPSEINIADTSTGSDAAATGRRIYLQNSLGQYVTESGVTDAVAYTSWPIADGNSISLDVLENATALSITVMYTNVSGVSVSQATELCGFTLYAESFYYSLTQAQAQQNTPPPTILQDSNYYMQKMMLRVNIDSGNNAITYGDDIVSAQNCYNLANYQIANETFYF
jgi:hypothetical protein